VPPGISIQPQILLLSHVQPATNLVPHVKIIPLLDVWVVLLAILEEEPPEILLPAMK
jgi:hypothetical protein